MLSHIKIAHEQGSRWDSGFEHNNQQYQFHIITYGNCSYKCNGQDEITANKGDFILLPSDCTIHHYANSLHQKYVFSFQASQMLIDSLPIFTEKQIVKGTSGLYDRTLDKLRPLWKEHQEQISYHQLRISSFLLDTLAIWQRELNRGELTPASQLQVDRMKQFIQINYRTKITKEELGDHINRSPNYAATLFKKGTSQTISEYVHSLRMKTALYMLEESLLNVTEISEYLGYSDLSYFQRLFKTTYSKPPSSFLEKRNRN